MAQPILNQKFLIHILRPKLKSFEDNIKVIMLLRKTLSHRDLILTVIIKDPRPNRHKTISRSASGETEFRYTEMNNSVSHGFLHTKTHPDSGDGNLVPFGVYTGTGVYNVKLVLLRLCAVTVYMEHRS